MPTTRPSPVDDRADAQAYRHLPPAIRVEDVVGTVRGDSPPDPTGEPNAFIAAAVNAGG